MSRLAPLHLQDAAVVEVWQPPEFVLDAEVARLCTAVADLVEEQVSPAADARRRSPGLEVPVRREIDGS